MTEQVAVKVGQVFVCHWGYDQSNVDFYEVIGVSKSGQTATFQRVKARRVGGAEGADYLVADTSADRFVEERCERCSNYHKGEKGWDGHAYTVTFKRRVRESSVFTGELAANYNSYSYLAQWDGNREYQTAAGYGH